MAKKLLIINGPNINMLGIREVDLYGKQDYKALKKLCKKTAKENKVSIKIKQNNCEGKIVTIIQKSLNKYSGIIINAGAYTHTSIAILDALKSVSIPVVEMHITDIATREEFRKHSYISMVAKKIIKGKGMEGYKEAIEFFAK